jgi:hypothetical protein
MHHFVTENLSPQVLIRVLEEQIQEGQLPPRLSRQIQEAVLHKTHATGQWLQSL